MRRRASNDGRRYLFGSTQPLIAFICECEREACYETVRLSPAAFDELRANGLPVEAHGVLRR